MGIDYREYDGVLGKPLALSVSGELDTDSGASLLGPRAPDFFANKAVSSCGPEAKCWLARRLAVSFLETSDG
jgi:hypothetical protein